MKPKYESKYDEDLPQEWQPPALESVKPDTGPATGDQTVKIQFKDALSYDVASVKFGGVSAEQTFKPPKTLVVTTPPSPYGQLGDVEIEIVTVYYNKFILDKQYKYVGPAPRPAKAASGAAKVEARTASPRKKRKAPAKAAFIAASTPPLDDDSALD